MGSSSTSNETNETSFRSVEGDAIDPAFKIKNLDTGESYFVGEAEGKIRDIGTGEEVPMETFQSSMGISPIAREVARRQREHEASTSARSRKNTESESMEAEDRVEDGVLVTEGIRASLKSAYKGLKKGMKKAMNHRKATKESMEEVPVENSSSPMNSSSSPRHIKVQMKNKLYKEMLDVVLTQELTGHRSAVWTLRFSRDGRYLASAGQDMIVRVWEVYHDRKSMDTKGEAMKDEKETSDDADRISYDPTSGYEPLFNPEPFRVFCGHRSDVLDLSWSDSQFLLSASMDKTVRLWHISMNECLRVFTHHDFVTSISFNPVDDKFFISGSLDEKLRIWNIPDHNVADWADVHEMVTAVSYTPDGKRAVVGTFKGKCKFYSAENNKLEYITQIEVRSSRGKNARGKKITGIQFLNGDNKRMLVSSNDSRIRLYDGYNLLCKYKGHKNQASQIRAFFSENGDFIISGSEDGSLFLWSTVHSLLPISNPSFANLKKSKDGSCEFFPAHAGTTTATLFAPESSSRAKKPTSRLAFANMIAGEGATQEHTKLLQDIRTYSAEVGAAKLATASMVGAGQVLVTAGFGGEIKVFECFGLPLGP